MVFKRHYFALRYELKRVAKYMLRVRSVVTMLI